MLLYPFFLMAADSFRTTLKRIKADLSEGELKELEKRFAAVAGSTGGAAAAAAAGGIRYVELLHWGAPRGVSGGGDDEVSFED